MTGVQEYSVLKVLDLCKRGVCTSGVMEELSRLIIPY